MKDASNHVSREQLLTQMINLRIDKNLVTWTGSFFLNRKVQLVIDSHDNKEKEIETGIPQEFPVSPILLMIFISEVYDKVPETNPLVTSLLFVDDLRFIATGRLVKKIAKTPENVAQKVLIWGEAKCNNL